MACPVLVGREDVKEGGWEVSVVDDLVLLAVVVAVVAVGLVGLMLALYLWALKRRRELDEAEEAEREKEGGKKSPPYGRYDI